MQDLMLNKKGKSLEQTQKNTIKKNLKEIQNYKEQLKNQLGKPSIWSRITSKEVRRGHKLLHDIESTEQKLMRQEKIQIPQLEIRDPGNQDKPISDIIKQVSSGNNDPEQILADALAQFMANIVINAAEPQSLILDYAQSNRAEIQERVENEDGGDWHIVWGVNMNDTEYLKLTQAVVGGIVSGGAATAEYFNDYLFRTMKQINKQFPELIKDHPDLLQTAVEGAHTQPDFWWHLDSSAEKVANHVGVADNDFKLVTRMTAGCSVLWIRLLTTNAAI